MKAFLFGTEAEAFEVEICNAYELQNELTELELWQRKGPVRKLHNIVNYIYWTP